MGCTQRECKSNKNLVGEYKPMFESLTSAGAIEKLSGSGEVNANIPAWSYDMEGHAKKCVDRYCELANTNIEQSCKVPTPCIDDSSRKRGLQTVGELLKVCSQIVLKCMYVARIGRPRTLWSVNKLASAVTKWTRPVTDAWPV